MSSTKLPLLLIATNTNRDKSPLLVSRYLGRNVSGEVANLNQENLDESPEEMFAAIEQFRQHGFSESTSTTPTERA